MYGPQGYDGQAGLPGNTGLPGITGLLVGPQGNQGKESCWNLPTCSLHVDNKFHYFVDWHELTQNVETLEMYALQHRARLPCFVLDHVGSDKAMIACCIFFGATCCGKNRSNLARLLLRVPLISKREFGGKIDNIFDRSIQFGFDQKVKFLIQNELAFSDNITQYDFDPVVQDFLQRMMMYHRLSHSTLITCLIDIINDYLVWNDTKWWFQKSTQKVSFLHKLSFFFNFKHK